MNSALQRLVIWVIMGYVMNQYGMSFNTLGFWITMSLIMLSEFITGREAKAHGVIEGVWNTMQLTPEQFLTCKKNFIKLNNTSSDKQED